MRALLEHWLGNVLSLLVCVCLVTTAMLVPAEEARAATGTFLPVWRTTYVDGYTPITWPDENWTDIATATYTGGAKSATLTVNPSEQWILNDDQNAGILGLDSFQAGNFVQYNSNRPPIIFARYFAEQAQLRVTVIRVRRMGNTVHVQKSGLDAMGWPALRAGPVLSEQRREIECFLGWPRPVCKFLERRQNRSGLLQHLVPGCTSRGRAGDAALSGVDRLHGGSEYQA